MTFATQKRGRGRPPKNPPAALPANPSRRIECGVVYPLDEFRELSKLGYQGLREAQAAGLRVVYVGKNAYVRGDDWHAWLGDKKRATRRYDMKG